jgi:hypothetical protein
VLVSHRRKRVAPDHHPVAEIAEGPHE